MSVVSFHRKFNPFQANVWCAFGSAYTDTDKAYVWLLEQLVSMDQQERSAFLAFVTSSPRLPPGGLAQLPKGAIVV